MSKNVNIFYEGKRSDTPILVTPLVLDIVYEWVDDSGKPQRVSGTASFPEILASLSREDQEAIILDTVLRAQRRKINIDPVLVVEVVVE